MGFTDQDPEAGEILVSFAVVSDQFEFKQKPKQVDLRAGIDFKEYNVEVNVLGLRNLQSFGLLPVKKPFIKFNLKSLLPPE